MRSLDWSSSPLGEPPSWPQVLRSAVDLILGSKFPMFVAWGPELGLVYNDAYAEILGAKHPRAFGASLKEAWAEIWSDIAPLVDQAMAGVASYHENLPLTVKRNKHAELAWFTFSYSPLRDEAGTVAGMFCAVTEKTKEVLAARRRDALLELDQRLRDVADTAELSFVASELLGQTLAAQRVGFGVIDPEAGTIEVERNWGASGFQSVAGLHEFASYGSYIEDLRSGEAVAIQDVETDPRTSDSAVKFRRLKIKAFLDVPIVEHDRTAAMMFVHSSAARIWTDEEISFVREVAVRTRAAIARRSAEHALQQSEERFRQLAETIEQVFYVTDVSAGRVLYVSPSYERIWGRPASDLIADRQQFFESLHPEDREEIAALSARQKAGEAFETEYRIIRPDGVVRHIRDRTYPVPESGGHRFVGVAEDETERRQAMGRFQSVFNSDVMGFTIFDAQTRRTLAINDCFLAMTGHSRADFEEGRWDWRDFTVSEHLSKDEAAIAQALERGWWDPYEKEYRRLDGLLLPVRISSAPLPGEPGIVVVAIEDISQRRAAEDALRASEALARTRADEIAAIFHAAPVGLCVFDREMRYVRINERLAEINGRPAAEHIGRTVREMVPALDDQAFEAMRRVLEGEALLNIEFVGETPAQPGAMRTWRENWLPLRGSAGEIVGIIASAEEITDAKRAEAELRELNETLEQRIAERTAALAGSQRRFQGIFDSALQFMALLAPDGTVLEVNRTALAWSQVASEEIVGKPFWLAAPMRENIELQAAIERGIRLAAAGATVREEHEMRGAGNTRAIVDFSLKPVLDENSETVWLVAEGRDITALKEAQEALRHSQKMEAMGQLTGGVAHDFNNLLTPIVGALDLLQRKSLGGEREQRLIDGAAKSADRAKVLVQRLLAFARRQPLQPTSVDLGALTRGMAELVASTTGPQIRVMVEVAEALPPAKADPNQLEMAILNLAVNARDAMPDGGILRISVEAETVGPYHRSGLPFGQYLRLSVADTGVGMDEATLTRAVEPFFSTKGIGRGTGLGLSMVHGLAIQLGGTLLIQSAQGLGTNIDFYLPRENSEPAHQQADPTALDVEVAKGTVLLVDDEDLVRLSTADMLTELGYHVVEAASAEDALRLLGQGLSPDVVITDHLMPGMTGTDLANRIKSDRPAAKVLVISGYAETAGLTPDLPRLTKPFRTADLVESLTELNRSSGGEIA